MPDDHVTTILYKHYYLLDRNLNLSVFPDEPLEIRHNCQVV